MFAKAKALLRNLKNLDSIDASLREVVQKLEHFRPETVYLGDYQALTPTVWGQYVVVDTRDVGGMSLHLLKTGCWEEEVTRQFLRCLKPGRTVLEVGANVGYYVATGAPRVGHGGRYIAFEANPHLVGLLHRTVEVNRIWGIVEIVGKAAFSHECTLEFETYTYHHGNGAVRPPASRTPVPLDPPSETDRPITTLPETPTVIEVEAVSIDGYLASRDLRIDLVKIDAEGSELEVFRGMEKHLRASHDIRIIMELNQPVLRRLSDPGELCDYMRYRGFGFHVIEPPDGSLRRVSKDELLKIDLCEVFLER